MIKETKEALKALILDNLSGYKLMISDGDDISDIINYAKNGATAYLVYIGGNSQSLFESNNNRALQFNLILWNNNKYEGETAYNLIGAIEGAEIVGNTLYIPNDLPIKDMDFKAWQISINLIYEQ